MSLKSRSTAPTTVLLLHRTALAASLFGLFALSASPAMAQAPLGFCAGLPITILGTDGPDTLEGTSGDDVIAGLDGDDHIDGLRGDDTICGGSGSDTLIGNSGKDRLRGDRGPDQLFGGSALDDLDGGPGVADFCDSGPKPGPVTRCEQFPEPT